MTTNQQKINKTSDKKNNTLNSSITDLLVSSTAFSLEDTNKKFDNNKQPNDIVDILENDYKPILTQKNHTTEDTVIPKIHDSDKNNLSESSNNITSNYNKKSSFASNAKEPLSNKMFLPNKNKKNKKSRNLNQIISILRADYRNITTANEKFQYYNFDSMNDTKRNNILNQLEYTVFSSFQSLNQLSNLVNSNCEIKESLQNIFNNEDIISHSSMYAYNIYSLMKMYQYKKNFAKKKNSTNSDILSFDMNSDDDSTNNSNFDKKQFDTIKFIRDGEIQKLNNKSSYCMSSIEYSNLQTLQQERSIMEGTKSNIRLNILEKNRNQSLKEEIINSKRILSGTIFTAKSNSYDYMNDIAAKGSLSAKNSIKILNKIF